MSLDFLIGACWFSTIDLVCGYNRVPVTNRDRPNTAFCAPFGLFVCTRMLFGLCNAPNIFQRLMEQLFGNQHCRSLLINIYCFACVSAVVSVVLIFSLPFILAVDEQSFPRNKEVWRSPLLLIVSVFGLISTTMALSQMAP